MISEGNNNLSSIARELELAPSTVSKHLQDLLRAGAIIEIENVHTKRWKYYKAADIGAYKIYKRGVLTKNRVLATSIVAVLAVLSITLYIYAQSAASGTAYVPISLTDPPQVPPGTQALFLNYSSVSVLVGTKGSTQWVAADSAGRIDLMSLINVSQVIAGMNLGLDSEVEEVRFNISSAAITINNVTYPVYTSSRDVMARMANTDVNSNSGILLDFSPLVIPAYGNNSTYFLLVPSMKAALIDSGLNGKTQDIMQRRMPLTSSYKALLSESDDNVTVVNETFSASHNSTSFGITLRNSGDTNATILSVVLQAGSPVFGDARQAGNFMIVQTNATEGDGVFVVSGEGGSASLPTPMVMGGNRQINQGMVEHIGGIRIHMIDGNGSMLDVNATQLYAYRSGAALFTIRLQRPVNQIVLHGMPLQFMPIRIGQAYLYNEAANLMLSHIDDIIFVADRNGTLLLPYSMIGTSRADIGYTLAPDSMVKLTFNGVISLGKGDGRVAVLSNNTKYRVSILTSKGIASQSNVTYVER